MNMAEAADLRVLKARVESLEKQVESQERRLLYIENQLGLTDWRDRTIWKKSEPESDQKHG